ncbi:MAG TPA: hypothetical protein VJP77_06820 [Planctomycetota bacterium]|nr:hypothetical protein [Planctomycetota bacterium]
MLLTSLVLASAAEAAHAADPAIVEAEPPIPAAVLALATRAPQAGDGGKTFSYTFVELGLYAVDVDAFDGLVDEDVEAYYVRGSIGLGFVHLVAAYEDASIDFGGSDTDTIKLGAGGHFDVAPKVDFTGDISWLFSDLSSDLSELDDSDHGYEVRAGLRWMAAEWERGGFELDGDVLYRNVDFALASDDEQVGFEAGARLHFLELLSVGGFYRLLEDDDAIGANVRLSF